MPRYDLVALAFAAEPSRIGRVPRSESIPFNKVAFTGREREYIERALQHRHVSSGGPFSDSVSEVLARACCSARALLTTSCTDALELSGLVLGISPGDEVILPSFTFVSTANAYVLRGARPVFVDVRADTFNIDERQIEAAVTERTRALVVVHYAGVGCEMAPIVEVARRRGLALIEDNAHGLYGEYRGQPLGSFGAMSTLSFHETKNFSCGEGGALCINDAQYIDRAEILHAKGTNRARFLRGVVDKYTWVDVGSSFGMSDLLAAVLCAQLEQREAITAARKRVYERYLEALTEVATARGWTLPRIPEDRKSSFHLFSILLRDTSERDALISFLQERRILAVFHYVPLHTSEMGERLGYRAGQFPVTEDVAGRLVRLPLFNTLSEEDQQAVVDGVLAFSERKRA
jgi:dTDP-4-amino-4,6-dideoxygalactose transaminase